MRNRILQNSEGISPVLGFILMLAVGVTILTTVQLTFVPVWNTQEELDHLKIMQDDFKVLKSNIESGIQSGTVLSSPLTMGFKYSPKMLVYNPREEAYASLEVQNSTWVEVRYNEVFQEGMTDDTSIKNVSTGMMIYALQGAGNYNSFIYENGLIRRGGSNYTTSSQTILANSTFFLPSLKALEYGSLSGIEKKTVNIYPTSQQKNSVIGRNVWIILHTIPDRDHVEWWAKTLKNEGAGIRKKDFTNGIVIANISSSLVIKMGEAYISASPKASPRHSPPRRLVRLSGPGAVLPVGGTTPIMIEVQDEYNNPVPNVPVTFSRNITTTGHPSNSYSSATISPDSVVSGSDGRASVMLTANDAGFYYIDAKLTDYMTTFVYSASSQGGVLKLSYLPNDPNSITYNITATLTDGMGNPPNPGKTITFETSDGIVNPPTSATSVSDGTANTTLDVSTATGIRITNIHTKDFSRYSANITWDTVNNITVTAKSGYVFNSIDVYTAVDTSGCVFYGTSPGNHSIPACSANGTSHLAKLDNLQPGTAYYFIINSTRQDGTRVNSTEYMFVTQSTGDEIPPGSVTGLANITYEPLYIRWTWTDPADADFDHVEVMIDEVSAGTVAKGTQSFNATYLMPNRDHNISIRTVDTSNNANSTWVTHNASTRSLFSYLEDYTIDSGQGVVTGFSNAQNPSDGDAAALFNETQLAGTSDRHNYTNVTGNATTLGNISNWLNMRNDSDGGAFANLTEIGTGSAGGTSNYVTNRNFTGSDAGWTRSEVDSWNFMIEAYDNTVGNTAPGGSGVGSEKFTYNDASNTNPTSPDTAFARITSSSFTAPSDITAISARFAWYSVRRSTAARWGSANYKVRYMIVNSSSSAEVARIYDSGTLTTFSAWSFYQNNSIPTSTLTNGYSYQVRIELEVYNPIANNRPGMTLNVDDIFLNITTAGPNYSMNITADTTSVPVDDYYYLEINYSRDSYDTYNVYVYNGSTWNNRTSLNATPGTWVLNNYTLNPEEYNSGNPRVRYLDNNPSGTSRGNLSIDYQRIHGYTPGIQGGNHLDVTTNTTGIPESTSHILQLRYYVSGDNFTLQIYNGSSFAYDTVTNLNQTSMTTLNIPLTQDYMLDDGTFGAYTTFNLNRYYVLVKFIDNRTAAPGGKLYLDYQRVYSS